MGNRYGFLVLKACVVGFDQVDGIQTDRKVIGCLHENIYLNFELIEKRLGRFDGVVSNFSTSSV